MALFEATDIYFNYGDKELYRGASLKVNPGEHCVLVGANGCGKSTLLNILTGSLYPDAGKVEWTNGVTYSYLDQQLSVSRDLTLSAYLYGVYENLYEKEKAMERLYEEAALNPDNYEKILEKATRISDELEGASFYALEEKVGRLADGLGLDKGHMEMPLSALSGGQREKAYLAKMLLEERQVLIMDEPTNFLDATQVEWLARYLIEYPNAFLVVSHDRSFLSKVANVVFVLENGVIARYKGDYEHFLTQHEIDVAQYLKDYNAQQRYIKKEEQFIAAHIVRATSAKAAKSRRARLAHLDKMDKPAGPEGKVRFSFPFSHPVGEKPLIVENLIIGYKTPLLSPISLLLKEGEKVAILGENGVGKTTFVKTILGLIPSLGGTYRWLDGIVPNYYSQDEKIDLSLSPFDLLHDAYPNKTNTEIRTVLGSVGVKKELAIRPLNELSGGEMTKARFGLMALKKSNFLILDEPTNHLDQTAKDALFDAIEKYPGSVIIVSHEKDFYDGLVDYELYF